MHGIEMLEVVLSDDQHLREIGHEEETRIDFPIVD